MARISDEELERLKKDVSLQRLVEARGVKLKRQGKDLLGRCPFHDDKTPSLVVSPKTNLWHCLGACQAGGSVLDWVMKIEGVSLRHAVELLRADHPSLAADTRRGRGKQEGAVPKATSTRKLAATAELEATGMSDDTLLARVVDFYHRTLAQSADARGYLERRGVGLGEAIDHFKLGYANRTLGYRLSNRNRKDGAAARERLIHLGVLRETGHEHLSGSVVVPVFDADGRVVQLYGRKTGEQLRKGTPLHLYLPGRQRGVFNREAFGASKEIILCESIFDALTFWCAGHRHVTTCYGVGGFTPELREAFASFGTERVLLAFDRDEAGDRGAEKVGHELAALGIEVMRVLFPRGMDANEYALKVAPAAQSLAAALRGAVWLAGKRTTPAPAKAPSSAAASEPRSSEAAEEGHSLLAATPAAADASPSDTTASPVSACPSPARSPVTEEPRRSEAAKEEAPSLLAASSARTVESTSGGPALEAHAARPSPVTSESRGEAGELELVFGDRRWRIRMQKSAPNELRVNALLSRQGALHVDTLELYSARQRAAFVKTASEELNVEERVIKKDLGAILLELERRIEEARAAEAAPKSRSPEMSQAEREEALELLGDPGLLERVLDDLERLGVVGERTNKLVGYLAAVSRKLSEPLAVVIQSSSAAGKSSLMDAILALVPEEDRVQYSAMTGQSLFYMGEEDLQHRILAIAEEEGAERASYALKLLQSEGELTIASTGKDPQSGRHITHDYQVKGPVMIMLTTTAVDVDEELLNRCIVLSVDEGRDQTRAIHARQRRAQTLAGVLEKEERAHIVKLHRNAQRLLQPLLVVNPHAETLGFLDHQTRTRRDHMKYLTLIRTIAFLHQQQRPVKTVEHRGESLRYIEVQASDIELADRLCREVLLRSIDELPPQTRRLLGEIVAMVRELAEREGCTTAEIRFTRRHVLERTGWGLTQLKLHLHRLEELELLVVVSGGPMRRMIYELGYAYESNWSGSGADWSGSGRALVGGEDRPASSSDPASVTQLVGAGGHHRSGNGVSRPAVVMSPAAIPS